MRNYWILLFIILGIVSCDNLFNNTKNNQVKTVNKIEPIDFSSVDAFPLLPECKNITSRELQKDCFYRYLSKTIEQSLSKTKVSINNSSLDTIKVKIIVSAKGIIKVKSINISNDKEFNELKKVIIQSIETIPQISPAIKSGIPVTTEYILPIVLKSDS